MATEKYGEDAPIQLRADALRDLPAPVSAWDLPGMACDPTRERFGIAGDLADERVREAAALAEAAGVRSYRVEIAPDGSIAIVVGKAAETGAGAG